MKTAIVLALTLSAAGFLSTVAEAHTKKMVEYRWKHQTQYSDFQRADKNNNGYVGRREARLYNYTHGPYVCGKQRFEHADKNNDNRISLPEAKIEKRQERRWWNAFVD